MASTAYTPLSQSSTWSDITPIPQADGDNPLVSIMYSEEYRDAMDHFRAISVSGEKSDRVLELTETIIRLNPAHYTVWQYRMDTLLELKKDLEAELELMDTFAQENLKSYQVWHHRLLLLTHISPSRLTSEIEFIHRSLLPDPKNYHTWAYLHWLFSHFSSLGPERITAADWEAEEKWCDDLLETDGRNNSAWGWRWFLRVARPGAPADAEAEVKYTLAQIHKIPHNMSAWNYLRGVIKHFSLSRLPLVPSIESFTLRPSHPSLSSSNSTCTSAYPIPTVSDQTPLPVALALEFLAESKEEEGRLGEAMEIYSELGRDFDRMRASYWDLRRRECV